MSERCPRDWRLCDRRYCIERLRCAEADACVPFDKQTADSVAKAAREQMQAIEKDFPGCFGNVRNPLP